MRIISGFLKGRAITPPKNFQAHPTTDFAKEGLFNILENTLDLETTVVLDLFSGSGNIAFECISRGCTSVHCVEMNPIHTRFIDATAKALGISSYIRVVRNNVFDFLKICTQKFHFVFADPPYDLPGLEELPIKILQADILEENGLLVVEHPGQYTFDHIPGFEKTKKYGQVHFSFFAVSKTLPTFALPNK
ncbi:MAG: RsmD family RNA methyltransferase [Bacteroidales bacterium]|jgi:16S rRNA (guanine(966)-N(2))-methyltransferase RsmD|nr:RsmD family RNA methyltransferase [Bacteroidales bacterium]HHV41061.1 16S rRNA (guanine(966)-N(2))-methyltransferase RsmD [Bacteroidales bacterium]